MCTKKIHNTTGVCKDCLGLAVIVSLSTVSVWKRNARARGPEVMMAPIHSLLSESQSIFSHLPPGPLLSQALCKLGQLMLRRD